jgi:ubiquinone/menaquinone biosynthesis C-methylase UbiE
MAASYLDMQAAVGISKHQGGLRSTRALHALCQAGPQSRVLHVGCGTGAGPTSAARTFGARVTGVDLSPQMVARASLGNALLVGRKSGWST